MILDHAPSTGPRLLEAEDLGRFKLRLSAEAARPEIEGVTFIDDDNALIAAELPLSLPGAPTSAEWRAGYRAMIAYAATKGWIDPATNGVRAHVERVKRQS